MVAKSYNSNEKNLCIEDRIINAFNKKLNKGGEAYASGKQLIIFLNSDGGSWNPRKVAKKLPKRLCFADVWVVGLLPAETKQYVYSLSQLGTSDRDAPTWKVYIEGDFCSWKVESIQ